jgi:hypothetical protein
VTVTYQPYHTIIGGVLGDAEQVTLHYGFNGWSDVADQPMNGQGEVKMAGEAEPAGRSARAGLLFTDGTRWDNNDRQDQAGVR